MASASTLTSVAHIFKKYYSPDAVGDLAMRDHPFHKMVKKTGGFGGNSFDYAVRYGNPQGVSTLFADAQTDAASSKGVQFSASRFKKYGVITMDGEALAAAQEGPKGAFLDLVQSETEGILEELGDRLAFDLYRDGTGVRGIRSSESTDVTTLTVADDARNFKVGMTLWAADASDGSTPRSGTTPVTSVDEDAGTVGFDTSVLVGYVDGDFLFANGDDQTSGAGCLEGLALLFPLTAPVSGDSFRGKDRSADARRLAGVRVDDTATSIEENAGLVGVKIGQVGKRANAGFLNPIKFWEVVRRLNAKVEYDGGGGKADYGFEFVSIHTPAGSIKFYSDPDCPPSRGYIINTDSLCIKHLKSWPHIISDDGRPSLRQTSDDGVEARARAMGNLICTMPGANGVFSI